MVPKPKLVKFRSTQHGEVRTDQNSDRFFTRGPYLEVEVGTRGIESEGPGNGPVCFLNSKFIIGLAACNEPVAMPVKQLHEEFGGGLWLVVGFGWWWALTVGGLWLVVGFGWW